MLTSADVLEKSTYYVLDASGNTISVYERTVDENEEIATNGQGESGFMQLFPEQKDNIKNAKMAGYLSTLSAGGIATIKSPSLINEISMGFDAYSIKSGLNSKPSNNSIPDLKKSRDKDNTRINGQGGGF